MNSNNIFAISSIITGIFCFLLTFFVYLKNKEGTLNKIFVVLFLSVGFWSTGLGLEVIAPTKEMGLFWSRFLHAGVIFIAPTYLHFVCALVDIHKKRQKILIAAYLTASILFFCNFTDLLVRDVTSKSYFNYYTDPGVLYPVLLLVFSLCVGYGFYLLIAGCRIFSGSKRNQIKYFLIAATIGFSAGSTTYLPVFNLSVPPLSMLLVASHPILVGYAIIKYRLMDINVVITKGFVYMALLALSGGIYFGLTSGLDKTFSKYPGYNPILYHLFAFLVITAVLIHLIPELKTKAEKAVEQVLFKDKYLYRDALREFSNEITFSASQKELLNKTVNFISKVMGVPYVSIVLKDEIYGNYALGASVGFSKDKAKKIQFAEDAQLVKWLAKNKKVLIKEEMEKIIASSQDRKKINEDLKKIDAYLCIPLFTSLNFLGFLGLSQRNSNEMYSHIDTGLLQVIINQISLVITYRQLEQHMLQSEKLSSLGTLAAGIAHEIKNPLSSIQVFAQLFPQKYNDEKFRNDFSRIVVSDVVRISRLIDNILSLTKPKPDRLSAENINEVVDESLSLLKSEITKNKVIITKSYGEVPPVNINDEELKQVFLNIILNAIQAMKQGGKLNISSSVISNSNNHNFQKKRYYVRVKIQDSGPGIKEPLLNKLFDPFFTTKAKGTGLGLALAHRIVEQHHGVIGADSKPGKGTLFWIDLPVETQKGEK